MVEKIVILIFKSIIEIFLRTWVTKYVTKITKNIVENENITYLVTQFLYCFENF